MKKIIAMLLVLSLALAVYAGGAKEQSEGDTAETIVWAGWSGEEEASKAIFTKMRETYEAKSGNRVSWVGWTWADTAQQLLIRLQGGEQLDIAQVDISIFNTIAQTGTLADLNDIFGREWLAETFPESALEVGNIDGKQLALPWSMASITMVYNPEILKRAGWDTVPETVEEFEQCLEDIKALGEDIVPYGVSTKDATAAGDFMPWLWTFGSSVFNEDGSVNLGEEAVSTVEWYQKLLAKGYIKMDVGRGDARQLFAQGKMAFYDDAVVAKGQAVNNGVKPEDVVKVCSAMKRPVLKSGDESQSTMWGHMLVIFNSSSHKAASADFAKTLVSDDIALEYFEKNGMPPVTKSAGELDEVKNDAYLRGFMEATASAKLEETARLQNASEIKAIMTEELQAALLGQKTASDAVSSMKSRISSL
jgi:multiple sugar transport system substrate-binding protein